MLLSFIGISGRFAWREAAGSIPPLQGFSKRVGI